MEIRQNEDNKEYYVKEDPNSSKKSLLRHLLDVYGNQAVSLPSSSSSSSSSTNNNFHQRLNRNQLQHLIASGAVKVNNEVVTLFAHTLDIEDINNNKVKIEISNDAVRQLRSKIRVWALNKPEGVVTTFAKSSDLSEEQQNQKTLLDFISTHTDLLQTVETEMTLSTRAERRRKKKEEEGKKKISQSFPLFPVGRLDKDSCGLLLLTNCGSLTERLLNPLFEHEKEYIVQLDRSREDAVPERFWKLLREGVSWKPNGEKGVSVTSKPCQVESIPSAMIDQSSSLSTSVSSSIFNQIRDEKSFDPTKHTFRIKLKQGLNRQIRCMVEAAGKQVNREFKVSKSSKEEGYHVVFLKRVAVGPIKFDEVFCRSDNNDNNTDDKHAAAARVVVEIGGALKETFLNWAYSSSSSEMDSDALRRKRTEDEADTV